MIAGKYGYVDPEDKFIVYPIFEKAGDFMHREYACVTLNGKMGWIKKDGSLLTGLSGLLAKSLNASSYTPGIEEVGIYEFDR